MGSGIAQICAVSGRKVVLVDTTDAAVERGRATINATLARSTRERSMLPERLPHWTAFPAPRATKTSRNATS